jgi:hypothetical protein
MLLGNFPEKLLGKFLWTESSGDVPLNMEQQGYWIVNGLIGKPILPKFWRVEIIFVWVSFTYTLNISHFKCANIFQIFGGGTSRKEEEEEGGGLMAI